MAIKFIDTTDHRPRWLRKEGNVILLVKEKRGHLLDSVPDNWSVEEVNGRLRLMRKK